MNEFFYVGILTYNWLLDQLLQSDISQTLDGQVIFVGCMECRADIKGFYH